MTLITHHGYRILTWNYTYLDIVYHHHSNQRNTDTLLHHFVLYIQQKHCMINLHKGYHLNHTKQNRKFEKISRFHTPAGNILTHAFTAISDVTRPALAGVRATGVGAICVTMTI